MHPRSPSTAFTALFPNARAWLARRTHPRCGRVARACGARLEQHLPGSPANREFLKP